MKAATLSQSTSRIPQPALYPLEGYGPPKPGSSAASEGRLGRR
jgi:hypothetical protein